MTVRSETMPDAAETALAAPLPRVSLVLPAFNEAAILEENLAKLLAYTATLRDRYRWEIVVVDDGSTDGTGTLADAFAAKHPGVRVIHHVVNLKLGQALRTGFEHCRGDYVVVLDLDLSYSPDHVERILRTLVDTRADIVVASPYMAGGRVSEVPPVRLFFSRWANRFLAYFCHHADLHTITGMVRGYRREFLDRIDLRAIGIEINTEIIYKAMLLRGRILEIPAHLDWRLQNAKGKSRVSSFRIYRGILSYVVAGFIFRPFMFFLLPGISLMAVSAYVLAWIFVNVRRVYATLPPMPGYFDDRFSAAVARTFHDRPYAFLVGGITLLVAFQFLSLGILSLQNKKYFEELFHIASSVRKATRAAKDPR